MKIGRFEFNLLPKPKTFTTEEIQHLILTGVQAEVERLHLHTVQIQGQEEIQPTIALKREVQTESVITPITGGRSSISEAEIGLYGLVQERMKIANAVPTEIYEALEYLSVYNNDFSYAVDNIVQLGNTPFTITYEDNTPEEKVKEMNTWLATRYNTWYANSTGLHSLINDLLAQACVTGVISAEIVPKKNIFKGLEKAVIVSPMRVKFVYDKTSDTYLPYQDVNKFGMDSTVDGMIPLNPVTYKYIAMRRLNEKPYGVPPFLSCLEHIVTERSILTNVKYIIEKFGVLGFLQILVTPPQVNGMNVNVSDPTYELALKNKAIDALDQVDAQVKRGLANGYLAGFKGQHEIEMKSVDKDTTGAEALRKMNRSDKMTGLKQDPLMFGQDSRTSEALARVLLEKMGKQVSSYQEAVGAFLSAMFKLELNLSGFPVQNVTVVFEKPTITDKLKEASATQIEILNGKELYNSGIISQQQLAQLLGYEKPDQEEPRVDPTAAQNAIQDANANATDGKGNKTKNAKAKEKLDIDEEDEFEQDLIDLRFDLENYASQLHEEFPVFDYGDNTVCGCGEDHEHLNFDLSNDNQFDQMFNEYVNSIEEQFRAEVRRAGKDITARLKTYSGSLTLEIFADVVFYTLYKNWTQSFSKRNLPNVKKHISLAYREFRKSTKVFNKLGRSGIPDATFGLRDARAIEYMTKNDNLYLGKFITDPDTKKRLNQFIKEKYLEGDNQIGNNKKANAEFRAAFGEFMQGEEWKIRRVISTTLNKVRNYAAVSYMEQAEVETFEIRGVNDRLQCGYCSWMQGKQFSVAKAVETMDRVVQSDPLSVKYETPFITAKFKKPEDLAGQTPESLQALGIAIPPFHGHCRDVVVAVL